MTQENQPESKETTDLTSNSDVLLTAIVRFSRVLPINIVLFVQGTIISGLLISENEYFEYLKKSVNFNERLRDGYNKVLDDIKSLSTESPDYQDKIPTFADIEYIHLKNVKYHNVNTIPNSEGFYWRGRLSSIDGFTLL